MAGVLKTPEILTNLGIADTVENYKRNLRANTKTAAELIGFAVRNHLIG